MRNISDLMSEKDILYAILENNDIVEKKTFQEIRLIPHVKYFLWLNYKYTYQNRMMFDINSYQHFIINEKGDIIPLKIGNFEIVYIDEDNQIMDYRRNHIHERKVQIRDIRKNKIYSYTSNGNSPIFIVQEMESLLKRLNELGSWEAYINEEKLKEQENQYHKLQDDYNNLKIQFDELKTNYQELKNKIEP